MGYSWGCPVCPCPLGDEEEAGIYHVDAEVKHGQTPGSSMSVPLTETSCPLKLLFMKRSSFSSQLSSRAVILPPQIPPATVWTGKSLFLLDTLPSPSSWMACLNFPLKSVTASRSPSPSQNWRLLSLRLPPTKPLARTVCLLRCQTAHHWPPSPCCLVLHAVLWPLLSIPKAWFCASPSPSKSSHCPHCYLTSSHYPSLC
jgi:hypothetical protein